MTSPPKEVRFRFDQYEVDLPAAELLRNGRRVPIQDKPLRLLAYLAQRGGQVVSRQEIQEHLWPPDTTIVFDDGLNTAIKKLREALRDNSEKPRYLETVRGRGYRFLGKVEPVETMPEAVAVPVDPQTVEQHPSAMLPGMGVEAPPRRRALWGSAAALAGVAVCIAAAFWSAHRHKVVVASVATDRPHFVAVLPIANLTGDPKRDYLCDGVTEEVIARLGDVDPGTIRVIARTSAMSFRNTTLTARQIGDALGVDYLIEGTLQGDPEHVRLIVRLVRVSDQSELWGRTFAGGASQLQDFETEIADQSAQSLPGTRTSPGPALPARVSTEAHDLYLQGLYAQAQRSRSGMETALLNFGDALQQEPRYAQAYAQLAVTYNLMGQYDWMRQEEARSQGRAAAVQALAIDPNLVEAHAALGFSYWFYDWDSQRGQEELASAVAHDPNNVDAHHWLAMVLMTNGHADQAEVQMREALALDPRSLILNTNLGWVHYIQGQFPRSVQEMTAVERENPDFSSAHHKLQYAEFMAGDKQRAWEETQVTLASAPELSRHLAQIYANDGFAAAMKALGTRAHDDAYANPVDDARYLVFADDHQGAIRKLQEGLRTRDGWMVFVPGDPAFGSLHSDIAFQQIVQKVQHK